LANKLAIKPLKSLHYEELEQRVLFSADVALAVDAVAVEAQTDAQNESEDTQTEHDVEAEASDQMAAEPRWEMVFVNDNVADYEQLIADLQGNDDNRIIEVVSLESDRDGIEQVSEILADRTDLSAVHFITHGADGQINLGSTWLTDTTLQANSDAVAGWGGALTTSGDILFYGCNIAADGDGQTLIEGIAQLTGADVAASDDVTGHTQLGGDWDLEYVSGAIETESSVPSNSQEGWSHLLAPPTFWSQHRTITLSTATTLADYPVQVQLDASFDYVNAQANGEDIRFFEAGGNELSYWIENWNAAGTSTVWIEVATPGTTTLEMFYGNPSVSSTSDPTATFYYYDDFEDDSVGALPTGWTLAQGAPTGTPPSVIDDGGNLIFSDGANTGGPVVSTGSWDDVVVSQDFRTINVGDTISHAGLIARYADVNNMVYGGIVDKDTAQIWYRNGGTFTQIGGDWSITALNVDDANWHSQELRLFGDTVELYIDDNFIGSADLTATGAPASGSTGFWSQYSNYEAYRDNHIVRSYDAGTGDIATTVANEGFAIDENSANGTVVGDVLATDPEGDTLTYSITAGNIDGAFTINSSTGEITVANSAALDFETNPTFSLTIQVEDTGALTDTDTVTINLNDVNDAPVAEAGGPYTISEGDSVTLDGSASSDQDGDPLTYAWDVDGDGAYDDATGVNPTLTWAQLQALDIPVNDDGSYTIGLQVDDGNTGIDTSTATLTVANTAPTLTASGAASVTAGNAYTLNLSATDPGNDTISGWIINWGDGVIDTIGGNPGSVTHTYTSGGFTYNISVSAQDEDGTFFDSALLIGNAATGADGFVLRYGYDPATGLADTANVQTLNTTPASDLDWAVDVVIGPDGNIYATGYESDNIVRFDGATGAFIDEFVTMTQPVSLAFGPDGNLYVASDLGHIKRFDGSTGAEIDDFLTLVYTSEEMTFGPDGNLYVGAYTANKIYRYDGVTGAALDGGSAFIDPTTTGTTDDDIATVEQFVFGPDGNIYVASMTNGKISIPLIF